MAPKQDIVQTRRTAAKRLGVDEKTLYRWTHEPWFPGDGRTEAGWNVPKIQQARDAQSRKGSESSDQAKQLKLATDAEKYKQAQLETKQKQLALQEREGELLPRRSWELFAAELLTGVGDWCDQLPDLIAGEVPKKYRRKVRERLKAELDQRRELLRSELERKAKEIGGGEDNGQK